MKPVLILLFMFLITSCGSKSKTESIKRQEQAQKQKQLVLIKFKAASLLLDNKQFKKSIEAYNKLLIDHPTSSVEFLSLYNVAYAYEKLGYCGSAANRYKKIVQQSKNNPALKSRSLYQLSLNYECLGEIRKAIASLVDAFKFRNHLPKEIGLAELPARLASLYSQLGNNRETIKYLNFAQTGLKQLNHSIKNKNKKVEILSKTYYFMGKPRIKLSKIKDYTVYIKNFKYLQQFLLRSAEIGHHKWSKIATDELISSYDLILTKATGSPQEKTISIEALSSINHLRTNRFPEKNENKYVREIFNTVDEKEQLIRALLSKNRSHTPLSKNERKKMQSLQKLRTANPNPALERATKKRSRLPKKDRK